MFLEPLSFGKEIWINSTKSMFFNNFSLYYFLAVCVRVWGIHFSAMTLLSSLHSYPWGALVQCVAPLVCRAHCWTWNTNSSTASVLPPLKALYEIHALKSLWWSLSRLTDVVPNRLEKKKKKKKKMIEVWSTRFSFSVGIKKQNEAFQGSYWI